MIVLINTACHTKCIDVDVVLLIITKGVLASYIDDSDMLSICKHKIISQ